MTKSANPVIEPKISLEEFCWALYRDFITSASDLTKDHVLDLFQFMESEDSDRAIAEIKAAEREVAEEYSAGLKRHRPARMPTEMESLAEQRQELDRQQSRALFVLGRLQAARKGEPLRDARPHTP